MEWLEARHEPSDECTYYRPVADTPLRVGKASGKWWVYPGSGAVPACWVGPFETADAAKVALMVML